MYDLEAIVDRSNTAAAKVDEAIIDEILNLNCFDDTIYMWVADMDFACSPAIIKALHDRVSKGIFGYTVQTSEYKQSIINWYNRRHNMKIKEDWIKYHPGTVSALRSSILAFTDKGNGIIIQPPVYYPFEQKIAETDRRVIRNELIRDENNIYSIDFADFEEKCKDPNNKMFIYCNPHNPIGQIWPATDTQRLLDICNKYDVLFFADEIHCDLIRAGEKFVSSLNLNYGLKFILATAVNKTFNVAGIQITNLVIPDRYMYDRFSNSTGKIDISPFSLTTTIAAYNESEDWAVAINAVLDENLDYMDAFIKEKLPRIKFVKPQGTYLTWLDFSDYKPSGQDLLEKIADEAHLILESGLMFGESGKDFIRMNIACPTKVLIEALDRLYKVFG